MSSRRELIRWGIEKKKSYKNEPRKRRDELEKLGKLEPLKYCPKCGGKAEESGHYYVVCTVKSCQYEVKGDTREEAIEKWNRRTN